MPLDEVGAVQLSAESSIVTLSLPLSDTVAVPVASVLGGAPKVTSAVAVALILTVPDSFSTGVGVCTSVQVVSPPTARVVPVHERVPGPDRSFSAMLPVLRTVTEQDTAEVKARRYSSAPVANNVYCKAVLGRQSTMHC